MNVRAAITIFVVIAISAAILVPLFFALERWRARRDDPRVKKEPAASRSIVVMAFVIVALIIFGFAGPAIFPGTWWGNLMDTLVGKALYVGLMLILGVLLVPLFQALNLLPKDPSRSTYIPNTRWKKNDGR